MIGRTRVSRAPSDLSAIRAWLKSLDGEDFVALAPASTRGGPYDADDVHVTATEVLRDRGLPADTPYIGWHAQTQAWDRKGRLIDLQMVYFGGDRARVRERLETIPDPFEIGGGSTDEEAFHIGPRFDAAAIDRARPEQLAAALEPLHHGHWRDGDLRFRLDRQVGASALEWLHSVVVDPAIEAEHRSTAFELLAASEAVTPQELVAVHAEVASAYAQPGEGHPPWYAAATSLIPLLLEHGRAREAGLLAARAAARRPEGWEAELFALAAPSPETLAVAGELGLHLAEARIRAALAGTSPRAEVIAVAERVRATADSAAPELDALVSSLPQVGGVTAPVGTVAPLEQSARRCSEVLTDPAVPAWLLNRVRRKVAPDLADLQADGEWAAYSGSPFHDESRDDLRELAAALAASAQRLAEELGDAALAWEPPATDSKYSLWRTLDEVRDLTKAQEAWFRATLLDPPPGAAAELDAYLLEPLVASGRFTREDADALLPGWRKRLARKHDTYQPVQPALLSFVLGLQAVDHPKAEHVRSTVLGLKPVWARGIQHVLRACADGDPRAELRRLVAATHLQEQHGAAVGLVLSEARMTGVTPLEALARTHADLPRGVDVRSLGLELASAQPRLLNDNVQDSPGRQELAEQIVADVSLPESFRARFGG
ncbi:hypothetical protein [Ornithinimicrobium faecis]|uniref:hypothetical protein n=1 Tax=Ornithinimicrobium faecis TaxID=2934158 RepID=UPI002118F74E|nr:hypothetical protein [Ornithinimicrobium sp. HY1745]